MKYIFVLLIILCLSNHVYCEDKDEPEIEDKLQAAAIASGNPEIAVAIEVLKALKTTSETKISERYDQFGFTSINNVMEHSRGAVWTHNLNELIKLWLNDGGFNSISDSNKNILAKAIAEYSLLIQDEQYRKQRFDLSFNDGVGKLFMMILTLEPHPTKPNAIKWEKLVLESHFKPAPSYVIITESDCDILSCDRTDKIVYMPVTVSDVHIHALLNMNLAILNEFNNNNLLK